MIYKVLFGCVLLFSTTAFSQYQNKTSGNFDSASSWVGDAKPVDSWKTISIVSNTTITKTGDFSWGPAVVVGGSFNVDGNCSAGYGGITINGALNVSLDFNGNLTAGSNAVVNVGSFSSGTVDVGSGSTLTISKPGLTGDCSLTNHSIIRSGATVIVYGDFTLQSNISIEAGGTLVVYGNFNAIGNWGMNISGNIVVKGDFSASNGTIQNNGNVVVGGDFTHGGGGFGGTNSDNFYIVNPDAEITPSDWGGEKYGDKDDFQNNETDNSDLLEWVEDVIPSALPAFNWIGDSNSNWDDSSNWATGKVPSANNNVFISVAAGKNSPVITNDASMRNLSIGNGVVTVKPGAKATVNGTIAVSTDGNLVIENDFETHPASFIHHGISSGNVTVKVRYPSATRNWYVGHPVKGRLQSYFDQGAFNIWSYAKSSTKEAWTEEKMDRVLADPTEGFVVNNANGAPAEVTFQGELCSGDPSANIRVDLKNRWNLVANPFNCYVDPAKLDFSAMESTIWFRSVNAGSYSFITFQKEENIILPVDESALIAPMQGFWVRAVNNGTLVFSSGSKVHPSGNLPMLKSSSQVASDVLYLELSNDHTFDQTAIAYRLSGSYSVSDNDSEKRISTGMVPNIYTSKQGKDVAINIQPEDPDPSGTNLGFSLAKGANEGLKLRALNIATFMPSVGVYLEDRTTGNRIDLRANPEYAFTSDPVTDNKRFVIKVEKLSTDIGKNVVADKDESRIRIYRQHDKTIVLVGSELLRNGNARVNIFNLVGSLMSTQEVAATRSEISLPAEHAIYLVEVEAGGQVKREKVVK